MKKILLFLTIILPLGVFAQKANIQVVAKPGISVFIDNAFQGKTSLDYDGLIIENVSPGNRTIKLIKEGFNPQEEKINIKPGEVYTYKVRPFIPKIKISESGNTGQQEIELKVGNLKIQSLPISITIKIPSLGVNYSKRKDEWIAEEIPEGTYSATFTYKDKSLNHQIKIEHNKTTQLMVNMLKDRVESQTLYISSKKQSSSEVNKLDNQYYVSSHSNIFTTYGTTLGVTNYDMARELGYEVIQYKDGCSHYCDVKGLTYWDHNCDGIFEDIYFTRSAVESSHLMPPSWKEKMGFDWSLSYNEWIETLKRLGYKIEITEKPSLKKFLGHKCFSAELYATKEMIKIKFDFSYSYEYGNDENSRSTLFSISIYTEDGYGK